MIFNTKFIIFTHVREEATDPRRKVDHVRRPVGLEVCTGGGSIAEVAVAAVGWGVFSKTACVCVCSVHSSGGVCRANAHAGSAEQEQRRRPRGIGKRRRREAGVVMLASAPAGEDPLLVHSLAASRPLRLDHALDALPDEPGAARHKDLHAP